MRVTLHKKEESVVKQTVQGLRAVVENDLRQLGIPVADKPVAKMSFVLPVDITRPPSAELSRIMGNIANQDAYLLHELGMWNMAYSEASEKYNQAEAKIICEKGEDIKQKYQIEAICALDKNLQALKQECLRLEGVIDSIKAASEGLHAKSAVLSREITRRQMEAELAHKL